MYHINAKTNVQIRSAIQKSDETIMELCERYNLSKSTVEKWKKREDLKDKSSRPHNLRTVLTEVDEWIICEVRKSTLLPIDDLLNVMKEFVPVLTRSNLYRCLKRNQLDKLEELLPVDEVDNKDETKPFKNYEPGYVHIDIKFLPKLKNEGTKKYLFVSIDRTTRLAYIALKDNKDAETSTIFLDEVMNFYPYPIVKILTDNGGEFTDRFAKGRKSPTGKHLFDRKCIDNKIEHRLTKPYCPKTNGMVERFNGRIKEILEANNFTTYKGLIDTLDQYVNCYNNFIKQKALDFKSPVDNVLEWYNKKPELFNRNFNISSHNLSKPNILA